MALDLNAEAVARLGDWLAREAPQLGRLQSIEKFSGGQSNPTYKVTCEAAACVLRRRPSGILLPKAHMIEREYAIMSKLGGSGVPVPKMLAYCEDVGVVGTAFYLMEFLDGRIFVDRTAPGPSPSERGALFDAMNDTVARLHAVRPQDVGLEDYGRAEGFMARQVRRWIDQYRAAQTREIPAMDALIEWLPPRTPGDPAEPRIFHGDLGMHNVMFHPTEPRVIALLDWELSTLGDPDADFAYNMIIWKMPQQGPLGGIAGLDLEALGIPSEAAYKRAYFDRVGREPPTDWAFYLAFSLFRMASIVQGIAKRAQDGNAASANASEVGAMAETFAEVGWQVARGG